MTSFGDTLKQARSSRGLSLDAVARETRIAPRYLEALERGDLDVLPGRVFVKGYLRSYAQTLGLDPEALVGELERESRRGPEDDHLIEDLRRLTARRTPPMTFGSRRPVRLGGAVVGGVLVGLLVWRLVGGGGERGVQLPSAPPLRDAPAEVEPAPASVAAGPPAAREAPAEPPPFTVPGHGVGAAVVDRRLVGRSDRFREGAEAWFWTRVVGADPGDAVRHVWIHEGQAVMAARLVIGASHWRTYSRLVLAPGSAGHWVVEARTVDGLLLARDEFDCVVAGEEAIP